MPFGRVFGLVGGWFVGLKGLSPNRVGAAPGGRSRHGGPDLGDLGDEIAALRDEVAQLRDEAADTRALAAMADRDAAGVRASISAINKTQDVLRETQVEHGRALAGIAEAVGVLVTSVRRHDDVLDQLAAGQAQRADTQAEILGRPSRDGT